ncbi:fumarylacetoacetate hydrolase family protein [Sphingobium subterraneum]|uniref:2-keto-4-pentenoate hydratase/2-oxohepta-3-ene-1,7-dioic acid hydratase in catechol pathway n=1 Tax=Sphingobium subterraneum TaxID=627688 RepID=A0A841J2Q7_9SPHN|nr:fumarylacetoacetate hydrolase family protein [Sphingobium subterraneum]MBB6125243.1 2-keto-4-pentenoate hydratase/2-oxohepta-3-ene-1,7-dioic acid hydratase in catechol pathway [Sphingobium subterraneum]
MKLVKFVRGGLCGQGIIEGDTIKRIGEWFNVPAHEAPFTLPELGFTQLAQLQHEEDIALTDIELVAPVSPFRKIICVGMNYRDHTSEIKVEVSQYPVLFTRPLDSLVGAGQPLIAPAISETYDFEGEIAVIIGKRGRNIAPEDAMEHIFGYSCFMDGSVREYQRHSLTAGKNFLRSGSMGPSIVTADEIGSHNLSLRTELNGVLVQSAHASDMIFSIPDAIAYCSLWTELQPGDVIATGTPGGVGSRRTPPLWMKAGDEIEVIVDPVGTLRNPVASEPR